MGESHQLDDGILVGKDDDLDKAYQFVLATDIWGITKATASRDFSQLILPGKPKKTDSENHPVVRWTRG